jgi:UDP-N-acetylglucosamine 2-epimerase (non-hydrolysing)
MEKKRIFVVLGTRPEAIKLAPLVLAIRESGWADVIVCNTSQHREMSAQVLDLFGIAPDVDLDIMRPGQSLTDVTTTILSRIEPHLLQRHPDWVVVQGDTTTTFASALAAYYQRIRVAHVEAGLRTGNIYAPWPEEMNRRLVSEIATLHFPPTELSRANLLREGMPSDTIVVTGNTGIDALKILIQRLASDPGLRHKAATSLASVGVPTGGRPLVLITGHRRESFGDGFESICAAISALSQRFETHDFVYPVHPNPRVRETVFARLGSEVRHNIHLVQPLEYLPFVHLMSRACLILTDSGGVQEEAPSLGKRVIVLREVTERSEGLGTGLIRLVGTDAGKIVEAATDALSGKWAVPEGGRDVYGDGLASRQIVDALHRASFA